MWCGIAMWVDGEKTGGRGILTLWNDVLLMEKNDFEVMCTM